MLHYLREQLARREEAEKRCERGNREERREDEEEGSFESGKLTIILWTAYVTCRSVVFYRCIYSSSIYIHVHVPGDESNVKALRPKRRDTLMPNGNN